MFGALTFKISRFKDSILNLTALKLTLVWIPEKILEKFLKFWQLKLLWPWYKMELFLNAPIQFKIDPSLQQAVQLSIIFLVACNTSRWDALLKAPIKKTQLNDWNEEKNEEEKSGTWCDPRPLRHEVYPLPLYYNHGPCNSANARIWTRDTRTKVILCTHEPGNIELTQS